MRKAISGYFRFLMRMNHISLTSGPATTRMKPDAIGCAEKNNEKNHLMIICLAANVFKILNHGNESM